MEHTSSGQTVLGDDFSGACCHHTEEFVVTNASKQSIHTILKTREIVLSNGVRLEIWLHPKGDTQYFLSHDQAQQIGKYMSVWVRNVTQDVVYLETFRVEAVTQDQRTKLISCQKGVVILEYAEFSGKGGMIACEEVYHPDKDYLWKDDRLHFRMHISCSRPKPTLLKPPGSNRLQDDLRQFLVKNMLYDCTIQCGNKLLRAHSTVLCARSPFFETMLSAPMLEAQNKHIVLKDVHALVMLWVLAYMYTDQLDFFWKVEMGSDGNFFEGEEKNLEPLSMMYTPPYSCANYLDLLQVAHRFQMNSLMSRCETQIRSIATECEDLNDIALIAHRLSRPVLVQFAKEKSIELEMQKLRTELELTKTKKVSKFACDSDSDSDSDSSAVCKETGT